MSLAPELVAILRCPSTREPLLYFPGGASGDDHAGGFLYSPGARLRYRIDDGIPVLLASEAEEVDSAEAEELLERARALGIAGATNASTR